MDEYLLMDEDKGKLAARQQEILKIVDALKKLDRSEEWGVLKELVFDKSLASIERQILNEALSQTVDTSKVYKLQGEWTWAKRYTDLGRFSQSLLNQLEEIKKKLQ